MLLALLLACAEAPPARPPAAVPVVAEAVVRGPVEVRLELSGEVRSPSEAQVAVEIAAPVIAVPARVGTPVRAGDELVRLDARPFEIARKAAAARVQQAEAQVAVRRSAVDRVDLTTRRVLEVRERDPASVSALDAEDAALALQEARAQLQAAEADLAAARAQLDAAELDLRRTRVVSPVDGVVARQDAKVGQRVPAGTMVAVVVGAGPLEAVLDLGEQQAGQVAPGAPVVVSLLARPSVQATGVVSGVVASADGYSRNQRVRVDLPSPPPEMLAGLAVRGVVEVQRLDDGIQVPRDAVGRGAVFVVAEGKAKKVPVLVRFDLGETLVVDGPLEGGAQVVVRGNEALQDGADVNVVGGKGPT